MSNTSMSVEERQAFLAKPWIAVVSIAEPGRGPLTVPVWYMYEPGGEVRFLTGRDSRKGRLLAAAGRISLCVQDPQLPYKYVSVEGPVRTEPFQYERDARAQAIRYLGLEGGDAYMASLGAGASNDILVILTPERWLTVDYSKEGSPA